MKQCGLNPSTLGRDSQDRSSWRSLCHEAVAQFEKSGVEALEHTRAVRKFGAQPSSNLGVWPCNSCSRICTPGLGSTPTNGRIADIDPSHRRRSPCVCVSTSLSNKGYICMHACVCMCACVLYWFTDRNECKESPNGGCPKLSRCVNKIGSHTCRCNGGYYYHVKNRRCYGEFLIAT